MPDLEYKLVVKDDGTVVLKKVGAEVDALNAKTKSMERGSELAFTSTQRSINKASQEAGNFTRTIERLNRTIVAFVGVFVFREIVQGFTKLLEVGMEFNSVLEDSKLGIASVLMAQGEFIDANGKALKGIEALNAAQRMSSEISRQLQFDNLKTKATYEQLVKSYQETIAPGLEVGFSPDQTRQYTVAMIQAAGALRLNLDMLGEETRSMLRGTITPRNTLIATALGIRPEDIHKYKGDVQGLYNYIMGRLSAFAIAGEASQMTWSGQLSNMKDAIAMTLGKGFDPLFNYLKVQMKGIQDYLISWKKEGPEINPEVVSSLNTIGNIIQSIVEWVKDIGRWFALWAPLLTIVSEIVGVISWLLSGVALFGDAINSIIGKAMQLVKAFNYINEAWKNLLSTKGAQTGGSLGDIIGGSLASSLNKNQQVRYSVTPPAPTYVPNPQKLTQEQRDEIQKLHTSLGIITIEEQARFDILTKQVPLYESIDDLTKQQQSRLSDILHKMDKSTLPLADRQLYFQQALQELAKIETANQRTLADSSLQIAEMNKNYDSQIKLIERITDLEIQRLAIENKLNPALVQQLRLMEEEKKKAVERQKSTEQFGYKEEIAGAKAAMAGMKGDLEAQIAAERSGLETSIQRRKVNQDLRGDLGKQAESFMRQKFEADSLRKIELNRLDYASRLASQVDNYASITGNYKEQAVMIQVVNELQVKQLETEGKLFGTVGQSIKAMMNKNALLKSEDTLIKGSVDLEQKRVTLEQRLAENAADVEGVFKSQRETLTQNLRILEFQIANITDPGVKESLIEITKLMKLVGISDENLKRTQNFLSVTEKYSSLNQQLYGMTGNVELYEVAVLKATEAEKERLKLDPSLKAYAQDLGLIIDRIADLAKKDREFKRAATVSQYRAELGGLTGDWNMAIEAEKELQNIEYQRLMTLGGLTEKAKEYLVQIHRLKMDELEAKRTLNPEKLMDIGTKKYSFKTTEDLANMYTNLVPNAFDTSFNAASNFFQQLNDGTTSATDAFKNFFSSLSQGFTKLLADLTMTIIKMELLKAIGYGSGVQIAPRVISSAIPHAGAISGTPLLNTPENFDIAHNGLRGLSRSMPASLLFNAKKLHTGLNWDEFPAILQNGETVSPKGSGGTTINIYNNTSAEVQAKETKTAGGGREISILIDQAVGNAIMSGKGSTHKAIKQMFGGTPVLSRR